MMNQINASSLAVLIIIFNTRGTLQSEWVSMWFWRKAKHWGNNGHSAQKEKKEQEEEKAWLI